VSERARGDLGSVLKKAERGRAHSHEQRGSPFIGQHGRRSGQAVNNKYTGLGQRVREDGPGLRRAAIGRDGRSARESAMSLRLSDARRKVGFQSTPERGR
jgi:hypothetical protein